MHKKIYLFTVFFCSGLLQALAISDLLHRDPPDALPEHSRMLFNFDMEITAPEEQDNAATFDALADQNMQESEVAKEKVGGAKTLLNVNAKIIAPKEKDYPKYFDALAEQIKAQAEVEIEEAKDALRYAYTFPKKKLFPTTDIVKEFARKRQKHLASQRERAKKYRKKNLPNNISIFYCQERNLNDVELLFFIIILLSSLSSCITFISDSFTSCSYTFCSDSFFLIISFVSMFF